MDNIPKVCIYKEITGEAVLETGKKWENGSTLKVRFLNGSNSIKQQVRKRFERYHDIIGLKFQFVEDGESDIRVGFIWNGDTASWSNIGSDALGVEDNEPTMNYGWFDDETTDEEFDRVVLHEVAHCIGFKHEQGHPLAEINWNRQVVIDYYTARGWSLARIERNVFSKHDPLLMTFTEYDPKSIMHYPIPREFVTDPNDVVGWNNNFSETDIKFLKQQYPKT
jgi:serralysin